MGIIVDDTSGQLVDMDDFLSSIERQAFRMAMFACHHQDDALDLVQEAMCSFVGKYVNKPHEEWKILFYRVLQNKIRDYYRRERVRNRWRSWFSSDPDDDETDPMEQYADEKAVNPESSLKKKQAFIKLGAALANLSLKQRQVFLLRAWEEMSVQETARIMACSEGTVKTHFSRANEQLRRILGDDWP